MMQRFVVVDLETTGNSPKKGDSIIQFACAVIENKKIVEEYSTYIKPEKKIPPFIVELTGINDSMVENAPLFKEVAPKINSLLTDAVFVAHNVLFDLSFLQEELKQAGFEGFYGSTIDTVELSKILMPTSDSYKLSMLAIEENLEHERPHQADSDAHVTALLLLKLMTKLFALPKVTLKQLYRLSFSLKSEISELIGECIAEKDKKALEPLDHLEIFRGLALKVPDQQEEFIEEEQDFTYRYNPDTKYKDLKRAFPNAEKRMGQLQMMNSVYDSFIQQKRSIIEAGTGIGKSLGYLLPAAYFIKKYRKKVIISTYTLHLQEQLLKKELPALASIVPFPIEAKMIKGKNNYLSLAKFERVLRQKDDNYDTSLTKMQILVWLTHTETGDRDELNLTSGGASFWDRLQTSAGLPGKLQEPWNTKDFYLRAKAAAKTADILVTNHAYLIQDITGQNPVLPKDAVLVLDEAHHFNKAYNSKLGFKVSYLTIRTIINRLGSYNQKMVLYRLEKMLKEKNLEVPTSSKVIENLIQDFLYESEQLFFLLARYTEKLAINPAQQKLTLHFDSAAESRELNGIKMLAERVIDTLRQIREAADERVEVLTRREESLGKSHLYYVSEAASLLEELAEQQGYLKSFFLRNEEGAVYWAEILKSGKNTAVTLLSQPLTAGQSIWDDYLSKFSSIIMTSATLTVNGSFSFFMEQLGLKDENITTESYPSPFNYMEAVKILIPSSMPEIGSLSLSEYARNVAQHIAVAATGSNGRMMVLFTSRELLRMTYDYLRVEAELGDYTLLAQGITGGSKWKLLKNFQGFNKGILLGNASFWDGVDVQGDKLSCLVIVRLPFSPPEEPVNAARSRQLIQEGKNPFSQYALPEAVLRFKQGFGRLIRAENEKGVLIVLDKRIQNSTYGHSFFEAIPKVTVETKPLEQLEKAVREWLT
ncbi:ATP-dependent DNA helicase DinG [Peribacillus deserti]|uniref:3'-5' exonuclease DinG n=1 Tax=Peribacillus deserti TaxID=673318 RepID=A0ABS2QHH5_9BACI|nr:ATP-dependent DNA helicase DinG [Peribacillus deserti]MBM7692616.1 ATP-dependent DNA helicase DinG [Peribacillus deserti]